MECPRIKVVLCRLDFSEFLLVAAANFVSLAAYRDGWWHVLHVDWKVQHNVMGGSMYCMQTGKCNIM